MCTCVLHCLRSSKSPNKCVYLLLYLGLWSKMFLEKNTVLFLSSFNLSLPLCSPLRPVLFILFWPLSCFLQQHHADCGSAVTVWYQPRSLAPAAERRSAQQTSSTLPHLWEGVDWVCPRHRADSCQEGVPGGVWRLLRVHAQAEDGECCGGKI